MPGQAHPLTDTAGAEVGQGSAAAQRDVLGHERPVVACIGLKRGPLEAHVAGPQPRDARDPGHLDARVEGPAEAGAERGPIKGSGSLAYGQIREAGRLGLVGDGEVALCPGAQMGVLKRGDGHPLAGLDEIGRDGDLVAVESGYEIWLHI